MGDLKVVGLGMMHETDGQQGWVQAGFDNFEYRSGAAAWLDIEKAVLCSWPENTLEAQVAVTADSLTNPVWVLCSEPVFKRYRELCVAVPITKTEQHLKLVPGTQGSWSKSSRNSTRTSRTQRPLGIVP